MGTTVHSYCPCWVRKAVLCRSSGWTCICQYPVLRSILEKYLAFPSLSKQSSILGIGYLSSPLMAFSLR